MVDLNQPLFQQCVVTDNQDPEGLGRIRVTLPSIQGGEETQSDWLPVITPYAGESAGLFCLPEEEDVVAVLFEDYSCRSGIVLGALYNETHQAPETGENSAADLNDNGENALHFIKSRSGLQIILDDTDGEEKIQLVNQDAKTRIEILAGEELINLETDKDVHIKAKGIINIEAEDMEFALKKNLDIDADSTSVKTGKDIDIDGGNNIGMEGKSIGLN